MERAIKKYRSKFKERSYIGVNIELKTLKSLTREAKQNKVRISDLLRSIINNHLQGDKNGR